MSESVKCQILMFIGSDGKPSAELSIYAANVNDYSLVRLRDEDAHEYGEEPLQILEGRRYEYEFSDPNLRLVEELGRGVVIASKNPRLSHCGSIVPGLNTGRLGLIVVSKDGTAIGRAAIEVRSRKVEYRTDYRQMLEDITDQCMSLLLELRASTAQKVAPDPGKTSESINQKFSFLRTLVESNTFRNALHRIVSHPHRKWEVEKVLISTGRGFRPSSKVLRQLARASRRIDVPAFHPIKDKLPSLPEKINSTVNIETQDTPENRFVKFALKVFVDFFSEIKNKLEEIGKEQDQWLVSEVMRLGGKLETFLSAEIFRGVSEPDILPLGSPVLQRKAGYREIYQAWLKFDMAARLIWHGGEDVYGVGQRNIAALYEYWVFFRLLGIVSELFEFNVPPIDKLIEDTADGFGLKLKSGKHLAFDGVFCGGVRPLRVRFHYNRCFKGSVNRTQAGSWTEGMRPDYTISLWPAEFTEQEAEEQELMVHVHFDAKYRVENVDQLFGKEDEDLDLEKEEQSQGKYKRADLLKMHAYRDAIRRTQGAYVIYPGSDERQWQGFHEILPGLGAFPLRPGKGDAAIKDFILKVVSSLCDRASNLDRQSYHTFKVQEAAAKYEVRYLYPERSARSVSRHKPPAETFVLVGWFKNKEHLEWIHRTGFYNFRMNTMAGSLRLSPEVTAAEYLFLHGERGSALPGLLRIKSEGPRVFAKERLIKEGYPGTPSGDHYLVFDVEADEGFGEYVWDYSKMPYRPEGRMSAWPYAVSLDSLLSEFRLEINP